MMKKYFWLKLKNDFFDREEIKLIEAMPNGKDYIIFYMKLLLKSIENNGKLFFRNTIPYSAEMLANVTNTNIDTVKVSVDIFLKFELMEKWDDGTLFMVETQNMIGSESKWAGYKRIERQKKSEIGHCQKMSKKIPIELDTELEKNIESSLYLSFSNEIERIDFKSFKKNLLTYFPNYEFKLKQLDGADFLSTHEGFCLKNGYIYNLQTKRFCDSSESFKIWEYLYSVRSVVIEQAIIQNNKKNFS